MEYYHCRCFYLNDEFILCKECSELVDNVETTIEKHFKYVSEFKSVVHAKRWKNNKKNQKPKNN